MIKKSINLFLCLMSCLNAAADSNPSSEDREKTLVLALVQELVEELERLEQIEVVTLEEREALNHTRNVLLGLVESLSQLIQNPPAQRSYCNIG